MENKTKNRGSSFFSKLLTKSSQKFLLPFFDDSVNQSRQLENFRKKINLAAAQKSLAVIQVKTLSPAHTPETISGWILSSSNNGDTFVLKLQKDQQLRMIALKDVKKISVLHQKLPGKIQNN